jgi:ubiquinone/menaquinone biosynthesis C-methylase UbiE
MKILSEWESNLGVEFLIKAGIRKNGRVLDFGCNDGNYTIPAAIIVGTKGTVFAIDKDGSAIKQIANKAKMAKLNNIRIIKTLGNLNLDFSESFFDFVMLYDMLHYLDLKQRNILYQELIRIIKPNSILSIHPKHTIENFPSMELRNMKLEELITEIEDSGLELSRKICELLSHDGHLEEGCIFNFKKI